jgi:hypothetical protein
MTRAQVFPCLMIALSLGAAIMYVADGDLRRAFYWFCASGITVAVTF